MIFPENLELVSHPELWEKHALFSPSQYHWTNYDRDRLVTFWENRDAQTIGTIVHSKAADLINTEYFFREKNLPYHISLRGKDSFCLHVMDSIKNHMIPEVAVKYSDICFGHADSLGFHLPTKTLRINDLKTGKQPGHMEQLELYAAIFFAEYSSTLQFQHMIDISDCKVELKIFQYNDCLLSNPPISYIVNDVLGKIRNQHEVLAEELSRRGM